MKNEVIAFKKGQALIYITDQKNIETHYVPVINWDLYMKHRKTVPKYCKIYDKVSETYDQATRRRVEWNII